MKKIVLLFLCFFFFTGCVKNEAPDVVNAYFQKYKNHDTSVLNSLEQLIIDEDLLENEKDSYRLIMKKQYMDLSYKIISELYNGDDALITAEIEVYDYVYSKKSAKIYWENHPELWDENRKYRNLQLKYMNEETKRVKYTIDFEAHYEEDRWVLIPPNYEVIQKIHGIYAYEED